MTKTPAKLLRLAPRSYLAPLAMEFGVFDDPSLTDLQLAQCIIKARFSASRRDGWISRRHLGQGAPKLDAVNYGLSALKCFGARDVTVT